MSRCNNQSKNTLRSILLRVVTFSLLVGGLGCRISNCPDSGKQIGIIAFKGLSPTHEKYLRQAIFPCQINNFGAHENDWEKAVDENLNEISFFVLIENMSDYVLRIGSEAYSIGYYSLELDFDIDGKVRTAKKREGVVWHGNLPIEDVIRAGGRMLYPVVLDERIWDYVPPREMDMRELAWHRTPYRVRPRLKGATVEKDGKRVQLEDLLGNWVSIDNELGTGNAF